MSEREETLTLGDFLVAANNADWQQVVLNGGPPCFHYDWDRQRFCLAAERWPGHGTLHPYTTLADMIGHATQLAALPRPIWDCRVCGFGVREGAALGWIRDHGEHYNAVSERVPNKGTAYCPTCSDETLRAPSQETP